MRTNHRQGPDPTFAFLNIPFDEQFEPLYLAFVAGLSGFGLIPQAVLQIPGSERRLDRLTKRGDLHSSRQSGSVFRSLTNALARSRHRPTVLDLQAIYRDLSKAALKIKRDLVTKSLFDTRPFQDLVIAASLSARQRIASLRDSDSRARSAPRDYDLTE